MGLVNRGTKRAGGTSFSTGKIYADEANTDLDTLYTLVNGGIDENNVSGSAAFNPSQVGDLSATDSAYTTATSPGDSQTTSKPTDLQGEIERLRYALERIILGIDVERYDGSSNVDCSWLEAPAVGPNLATNSSFECQSGGAGTAPDDWTLEGTPSTCALVTTAVANGVGSAISIVTDAANEGLTRSFSGLKASTRYLVAVRALRTTGNADMVISGALTSGGYRGITCTTTGTSYSWLAAVVETDTTPTAITVKLLGRANGDAVKFDDFQFRELSSTAHHGASGYTCEDTETTNTATHYATASFTDSGVSASVTTPGPGFVIEVSGLMPWSTSGAGRLCAKLMENGTEVQTMTDTATASGERGAIRFDYVNKTPTPGTTYAYTMVGRSVTTAFNRNGSQQFDETNTTKISVRVRRMG